MAISDQLGGDEGWYIIPGIQSMVHCICRIYGILYMVYGIYGIV